MQTVTDSPPRAPPIKYTAPLGTRWAKEKAAAGGAAAFDLPTDPKCIGPWILGECIGKGASGRVKIAKHRRTGQLAAVKILPIAPLVSSRASLATQQAKSDKQRLGIDREITMMKLMNHPNIMRIYDVYEGDKELFLVLEYVEGGELFDFLVNKGRLPANEALIYFRQIIYGLNYAHTFSIIHRDLKPENILIASLTPPVIKIADWGMAAFAPPSLELETSCGSPHYASPEIVNGEKYQGNATDIWSCGVILYALLTGRLPFDDKNVRTLLAKVKAGKYEMPNWIDPLARDLLAKMLIVDVKRRITVPEILSHPWLLSQPAELYSGPDGKRYTLVAPPLPPSPSVLARPLSSPSSIDGELLSSLRIIWGRHADPQGESIKRDLCSPMGQGVHAKAFYFLLGKYRDESSRNRSNDLELEKQSQILPSAIDLETAKFNLGWELDHSGVARQYEVPKNHHIYTVSDGIVSAPKSTLSPTFPPHISSAPAARTRTLTDSTASSRPASPIGPRHQTAGVGPANRSRSNETPSECSANSRPTSSTGAGRANQHPTSSKWAYTQNTGPERQEAFATSMGFSQHLQQIQVRSLSTTSPRPKSSAGLSTPLTDSERRFQSPSIPSSEPPHIDLDLDLPLLTAPKTDDPLLQRTMDDITQRVNELVQSITQAQPACEPKDPVQTPRSLENGKENRSVDDEGWSHISVATDHQRLGNVGLGVETTARTVGKDIANAPASLSPPRSKKEKERKGRPPPLELPSMNHRRSTFSALSSPISLSTPMHHPPSSSRAIASPVVGEFKGWFSNLFNWKHSAAQGSLLYSVDDIPRTLRNVAKLLDGLGIAVGHSLDQDQADVLFCRIDQPFVDHASGVNLKSVRFRIEFRSGPGPSSSDQPGMLTPTIEEGSYHYPSSAHLLQSTNHPPAGNSRIRSSILMGRSVTHGTPLASPGLLSKWDFPPGCLCAIALIHEKGSMSTFRAVWRRLKEEYGDASTAYPCFSPAMPNTPYSADPHQRMFP